MCVLTNDEIINLINKDYSDIITNTIKDTYDITAHLQASPVFDGFGVMVNTTNSDINESIQKHKLTNKLFKNAFINGIVFPVNDNFLQNTLSIKIYLHTDKSNINMGVIRINLTDNSAYIE